MKIIKKFCVRYSTLNYILLLFFLFSTIFLLSSNITNAGIDILGNWITTLIFITTALAGVIPLSMHLNHEKFEKKFDNLAKKIEKNQETTRDLYIGVSRVFRNISEQYFKKYENSREDNRPNIDYVSLITDFFITMINEFICTAESTNINEYKMFYDYYSEKIKYIKEKDSGNLDEVVKKITEQFYSEDLFVSRQKLQNTFGKNNKIINNIIKMLSFIYNSYGE